MMLRFAQTDFLQRIEFHPKVCYNETEMGGGVMFNEIKTEKDIQEFMDKTNQLHDGYITSVTYANNGIRKTEDGHSFFPWMTTLTLRVLVTSLWDATVEIEF